MMSDCFSFQSNDEDNMRQTVVLVEEYLQLVMTLVAERYTPGIGQVEEEDRIKKEIIQLLCIEPMPHSVLNKALPEGPNHETGMEKVCDSKDNLFFGGQVFKLNFKCIYI